MKVIYFVFMLFILCGCDKRDYTQPYPIKPKSINPADVIKSVQNYESSYPGVTVTKAIAGLLTVIEARGRFIDVIGWTQDYRPGGTYDVWLKVKVDDDPSEFHWVVTPDGVIHPVNKLARNVSKATP